MKQVINCILRLQTPSLPVKIGLEFKRIRLTVKTTPTNQYYEADNYNFSRTREFYDECAIILCN